jgi:hypothetical protein
MTLPYMCIMYFDHNLKPLPFSSPFPLSCHLYFFYFDIHFPLDSIFESKYVILVFRKLTYFTWHNDLHFHPFPRKRQFHSSL